MNRYPALMTIWLLSCIMAGAGLWACRSGKTSEKNSSVYNQTTIAAENKISKKQKIILDTPKNNQTFQIGEAITVKYSKRPVSFVFDSCQLFFDNDPVASYLKGENNLYIVTDTLNPGNHKISLIAYVNGKSTPRSSVNVTLLSDITPQLLGYKIINIYPHDRKAYTQGLVYENGFLYEGTGLKGKSSLRKVNLQTGEPVASLNLPPDLFGEGICILDNRIIQLTWTSGLGFVYDKNSFRFLNKIRYNTQGWGLTTDGTSLIMSDGSNHLYFIEPTYFSETSRIEVFDKCESVIDTIPKWELKIELSKEKYFLFEPIWLDVTITNISSDTLKSDCIIAPNHLGFNFIIKDSLGNKLEYTGPVSCYTTSNKTHIVGPNEQVYRCFKINSLYSAVNIFPNRYTIQAINEKSYYNPYLFDNLTSNEILFSIIELSTEEQKVFDLMEEAKKLWRQKDTDSSGRKYQEILDRYPNSVFSEQCFRSARVYTNNAITLTPEAITTETVAVVDLIGTDFKIRRSGNNNLTVDVLMIGT